MMFTLDETNTVEREIDHILTISTGHMTSDDSKVLRSLEHPLVTHSYEEGDFIIINDLEEKMPELKKKFSVHFLEILRIAKKEHCNIIRIDRDGPVYSDLKTFNW